MTSLPDLLRLRQLRRRLAVPLAAACAAALLLSACGGGTEQATVFKPQRVVVLGDENSVVVDNGSADGFKYTINDRSATTAGKCLTLPNFSQAVISLYGFVSKECNPDGIAPQAVIQARVGARVEDPATGLATQVASVAGGLQATDMVTLMLGANDVIAVYERVRDGSLPEATAVAEAQRLGAALAAGVNSLLSSGTRALVVTIPDMGLSPYAVAQNAVRPGAQVLLSRLSYEFNAYLRTRIDPTRYDGRNYGLILADDIVAAMHRVPTAFLLPPHNVTEAACTAAVVVDCLSTTLVTGAGISTHLWASDRHLGPDAHSRIGTQAQSRAVNNPF